MPILSTCIITYMYTVCLLDNGSIYTAFREGDTLSAYVDGELYTRIKNGKEVIPTPPTQTHY